MRLADELIQRGHRVIHVSVCFGDQLYWWRRNNINYRGRFKDWPNFLEKLVDRKGITDVLYYADRQPYHQIAAQVAGKLGLRATAYEFGYLRPDWITLERSGMSAFSHFPDDPDHIRRIAAQVEAPDQEVRYPYQFVHQATHEVIYNLSSYLLYVFYPRYRANRYYNPVVEYVSHFFRILAGPFRERRARKLIKKKVRENSKYFVFAMQLPADYQIRDNSPFDDMHEAVAVTLKSFAANAPDDTLLIFKIHPLDNGLERWPRTIMRMAEETGIAGRVRVIDGGNLQTLLASAAGAVLVNSTVGLHSILAGCPVKVLGAAVFDIPGITYQPPLDDFWTKAAVPDPEFVDIFVQALAAAVQVKGNFFTRAGQKAAIDEMATRLIEDRINTPDAFVDPPPRLAAYLADSRDQSKTVK